MHNFSKTPSWRILLLLGMQCLMPSVQAHAGDLPPGQAFALPNPAPAGARLPHLAALPSSGVLLSWVEGTARGARLKFAVFRDGQWGSVGTVAEGRDWFLNWTDFPAVSAISTDFWVAHWLVRHPGGGSFDNDIEMAVSADAGMHWKPVGHPHRDAAPAEHGFLSTSRLQVPPEGNLPSGGADSFQVQAGLLWLDGRDQSASGGGAGDYSLRFTTLDRDGRFGSESVVDGNVCTCCQTAAVSVPGGLMAAWRGHTKDNLRDHRTARWQSGGWSVPDALGAEGWHLDGCPTNGPALAARGDHVAAIWFSAQGNRPRVRLALSLDGGQQFGSPIAVDDDAPVGRVGIAWLDDQTFLVSWMGQNARDRHHAPLQLRQVAATGQLGPVMTVGQLGRGHDSGVPQLAVDAGCAFLAWTGQGTDAGVHTARVPFVSGCLPIR